MKKLKCECGCPLFYLIQENNGEINAYCLWHKLDGKDKKITVLSKQSEVET